MHLALQRLSFVVRITFIGSAIQAIHHSLFDVIVLSLFFVVLISSDPPLC